MAFTAPLTATITNADGSDLVYVTTAPRVNHLTVTVTNNTTDVIRLPPGTAIAPDTLPLDQSAVYLDFGGVLDNSVIEAMSVDPADGWSAASFVDARQLACLAIARDQQTEIPPSASLTLTLLHVCPTTERSGNANVWLDHAEGIASSRASAVLHIDVAPKPLAGDQPLPVAINWLDPEVYTGGPATLVLDLQNHSGQALVPAGTPWMTEGPPYFQLSFVYGDEPGALLSATDAGDVVPSIRDDYGNAWKPVKHEDVGGRSFWRMEPDPTRNLQVLGTNENASTQFSFAGIRTSLPDGMDSAITIGYVSWGRIPNTVSGSLALEIVKRRGPSVRSVTAEPAVGPCDQDTVTTVLSWQSDPALVDSVTFPSLGAQAFAASGSGPTSSGVTLSRGVPLEIDAHKSGVAVTGKCLFTLPWLRLTDIQVSAPAANDVSTTTMLPGRDLAFVFWLGRSTFSKVDLTSASVLTSGDLQLAQPPVSSVLAAEASPDASVVHLAVIAQDGSCWAMAMDAASTRVVTRRQVYPAGCAAGTAVLLPSADGTRLHFAVGDLVSPPKEVLTLSTAGYGVLSTLSAWSAGFPFATSPDARRLFACTTDSLVSTVEATTGAVTSTLDIGATYETFIEPKPVLGPDGGVLLMAGLDVATLNTSAKTIDQVLVRVRVDPDDGSLSFAGKQRLLTVDYYDDAYFLGVDLMWSYPMSVVAVDATSVYVVTIENDPSVLVTDMRDLTTRRWRGGLPPSRGIATMASPGRFMLSHEQGVAVLEVITSSPPVR